MSRRSETNDSREQPGVKKVKRKGAARMGGRFLLLLLAFLQLMGIVQSESSADTLLHGLVLVSIIVFTTRKEISSNEDRSKN